MQDGDGEVPGTLQSLFTSYPSAQDPCLVQPPVPLRMWHISPAYVAHSSETTRFSLLCYFALDCVRIRKGNLISPSASHHAMNFAIAI